MRMASRGSTVLICGLLGMPAVSMKHGLDPTLVQFGKGLRSVRKSRGISQEQLAAMCDVDRSYMGSIERGSQNPSLLLIKRVADGLGVPVSALLAAVHL